MSDVFGFRCIDGVFTNVHCVVSYTLEAACNKCEVEVAFDPGGCVWDKTDDLLIEIGFRRIYFTIAFPEASG